MPLHTHGVLRRNLQLVSRLEKSATVYQTKLENTPIVFRKRLEDIARRVVVLDESSGRLSLLGPVHAIRREKKRRLKVPAPVFGQNIPSQSEYVVLIAPGATRPSWIALSSEEGLRCQILRVLTIAHPAIEIAVDMIDLLGEIPIATLKCQTGSLHLRGDTRQVGGRISL
jgi:hypothetical protein